MDRVLSLNDVENIAGGSVGVITSDSRDQLNNSMFFKRGISKYLIHYETGSDNNARYGHWTCMVLDNYKKYITFFDSYGIFPDDELKKISLQYRKESGQQNRDLGVFLAKAIKNGYKVFYNEHQLQEDRPGINTCGRYCGLFLRMQPMNVDDFYYFLKQFTKKSTLSLDQVIVMLTNTSI